ncbi:MAG TPA: DUF6084 family protein [Gemmatimonadaceae bacterium]|jgi:hypothetical protein
MTQLVFTVLGAKSQPYAAVPTLNFRVGITEATGVQVHMIALRCQIQIEARRRHYTPGEKRRLVDLYGTPERWGETLRTMVWTHVAQMVPGFTDRVEVDLPVSVTYDFEVAAAKYLLSLEDGEVPLLLQFSGTVFTAREGDKGFSVEQLAWTTEAPYRLPVRELRALMDLYFPGAGWIRLRRDTVDALRDFKEREMLPTWDDVVSSLLESARHAPEPGLV